MCADEEVDVLIHFQSFDDDYADFETKIQDLDRRLATIFCQAFDDCNSIESCAKVGAGGGGPTRGLGSAAPCRRGHRPEWLPTVPLPRLRVREGREREAS